MERWAFGKVFRKLAGVRECQDARGCELRATYPCARVFEPVAVVEGPSGLRDWPRPFVFPAAHLDRRTIEAGGPYGFDVHRFDVRDPSIMRFVLAFPQLAREGIGPRCGRAELSLPGV